MIKVMSLMKRKEGMPFAEFKARRDLVVDGLNAIPGVKCHKPNGAFYVFPNIKAYTQEAGRTSKDVQRSLLHDYGVACLPGTSFGPGGEGYLVMGLARGRTLAQLVDEAPLSVARALAITDQILAVLAAVHEAGIVHGDLDATNLLVDETPDQEERLVENEELDTRRQLLRDAMGVLNDRERRIFEARRLSDEPMTLEDLSTEFGVSRERVRQIEVRAFEKVQKAVKKSAKELEKPRAEIAAMPG